MDGSGHLVRYLTNATAKTQSSKVNPISHIVQNDSNMAYNVLAGTVYTASGNVNLICSCVGSLYAASWTVQVEAAWTSVVWPGTPPPTVVTPSPPLL